MSTTIIGRTFALFSAYRITVEIDTFSSHARRRIISSSSLLKRTLHCDVSGILFLFNRCASYLTATFTIHFLDTDFNSCYYPFVITLRPYQQLMVDALRASLIAGNRRPLLVAPCGSGKTVMFCYFAQAAQAKGKRILILAHRAELLDQIGATLTQFGVRHGFIAPGSRPKNGYAVQVGSVFSVVRRLNRMAAPDLIIIDEAHHAIARSTFGRVLAHFPKAWRIGVTATPQRLSGEPLSDMFDDLILGPSVESLMQIGALSKYKLFAPSTISTENLHMRGGDYAKKEIEERADKPTITGSAVEHYRRISNGKRAIAFCCSIQHALHVASEFRSAGFKACSIDGSASLDVRGSILRDFKDGKIDVLTSCDLISEGFDLPAIEVAIMLRPTASLALHIQQTGRALRPYPGKEHAIILDHAGNVFRHGLPDDPREWTLKGRQGATKTKSDSLSIRTCPKCFAAAVSGTTVCAHCGFVYPIESRSIIEAEGQLEEIDTEAIRKTRKQEQGQAKTYEELVSLGRARGYRSPEKWAGFIYAARHGRKT